MINAIVFSKDRACQLDLFWRSVLAFVKPTVPIRWSIVYLASTSDYELGYRKFASKYPKGFSLRNEQSKGFRETTLNFLDDDSRYHVFFVDDDCFKSEWNPQDGYLDSFMSKQLLTVSLRMAPYYNFCYTQQKAMQIPTIDPAGIWHWKGCQGDWGYPMSLDGHVFRTEDIAPLIRNTKFANPNSLEAQLAHNSLSAPCMRCYPSAKIINIPANKVQTVNRNVSGMFHAADVATLNRYYLEDKSIDLGSVISATGLNAPHFEIPLRIV